MNEHERLAVAACQLVAAIYENFSGDLPTALKALTNAFGENTEPDKLMSECEDALMLASR